jgi:hypothetical protein
MKPEAAKARLIERLEAAGLSLDTLTVAEGVEAMLAYFMDERADGCSLRRDGDMLLFQWGTRDWGRGDGPAFEVSIVRQLKAAADPETEPRQLDLRFRFDSLAGAAAGSGAGEWCASPRRSARFRRFVNGSAAFEAVGQLPPKSVQLRYGRT